MTVLDRHKERSMGMFFFGMVNETNEVSNSKNKWNYEMKKRNMSYTPTLCSGIPNYFLLIHSDSLWFWEGHSLEVLSIMLCENNGQVQGGSPDLGQLAKNGQVEA